MECLTQNLIEIRAWAKEQNEKTRDKVTEESMQSAEEIMGELQ